MKIDVLRAWKDEEYYLGLSSEQRSALPANPAELVRLSDDDLRSISGGSQSTIEACTFPTGYCTRLACTIGLACATSSC